MRAMQTSGVLKRLSAGLLYCLGIFCHILCALIAISELGAYVLFDPGTGISGSILITIVVVLMLFGLGRLLTRVGRRLFSSLQVSDPKQPLHTSPEMGWDDYALWLEKRKRLRMLFLPMGILYVRLLAIKSFDWVCLICCVWLVFAIIPFYRRRHSTSRKTDLKRGQFN